MIPQQSERLTAYLKNLPLLDGYSLSIHTAGREETPQDGNECLCGATGMAPLCNELCLPSLMDFIEQTSKSGKPVLFRCSLGLYSFIIPFQADSCLICGGVRENLFNLYFNESGLFELTHENQKIHPHEILEQLEKLPVTTEKKVRETMLEVESLIHSFGSEGRKQPIESDAQLIHAIRNVAEAIGKEESFDKAIALFSETLAILFDIPAIALYLKEAESGCFQLETCWGGFSGPSRLPRETLPFHNDMYFPTILAADEVRELFPEAGMNGAICLPLADNDDFLGMAVLFDVSLTAHNIHLVELLADNLAGKLKEKSADNETKRKHRHIRLLEMFRTLALTEDQEDLLGLMMNMAAELAGAANGSLMLTDDSGQVLRIAASLGIHTALSRNLYTRMNEGIAGSVAVSGSPLLVRDIEREQRLGRKNRSRFVTKSCISLPLRFKGRTIGVLNLADKTNNAPFTSDDQKDISTFIDQATIILARTLRLGKAKRNSAIDTLTGLYNPVFLKRRLSEELSRSSRHKLPLTLVIVRLDNLSAGKSNADRAHADWLVKDMARIISASLRDIDLVGRFGDSDFCILLPSTPMMESIHAVERINLSLNNELNGSEYRMQPEVISASVGIASFPENGMSADDIISAARDALLQAEAEGGSKICFSASWPV